MKMKMMVLFFAVLIMMLTAFCYYVLNPYPPELSIDSASISSFSMAAYPPHITAKFDLTMSARNPNKYRSVHYNYVATTLNFGPHTIAVATHPSFHLCEGGTVTIASRGEVTEYYTSVEAMKGIVTDLTIYKAIAFDMNVYARASFEPPLEVEKLLNMQCNDVIFWFNSTQTATMLHDTKVTCHVLGWD